MGKCITIIQGHPDPDRNHLGYALTEAYAKGAQAAGHEVKNIFVADLEFPVLRTQQEFTKENTPAVIRESQELIRAADHLVICYPLWFGTMPALLKAFIEQIFRPGFAFDESKKDGMPKGLLKGKSVRIIITMGMPAFIYRWYFGAHSLKSLERNVLKFAGLGPIKETLLGLVEVGGDEKRQRWLKKMEELGSKGI